LQLLFLFCYNNPMSNLTQEQKIKVNNFLRSSNQRLLNLIEELIVDGKKPVSAPVDDQKLDSLLSALDNVPEPAELPPLEPINYPAPKSPKPAKNKQPHHQPPQPQSPAPQSQPEPQSEPATLALPPVDTEPQLAPPAPVISPPPAPSQIFSTMSLDDESAVPASEPEPIFAREPAPVTAPEPLATSPQPVAPPVVAEPAAPAAPAPEPIQPVAPVADASFVNSLLDNLTKKP
jgi:hypothetical protein